MIKLPNSALEIIDILAIHGELIQKEIMALTGLPAKTVRYAMARLTKNNIVTTFPNFDDMRSPKISLNPDSIDRSQQVIDNLSFVFFEWDGRLIIHKIL
ncbi:MAG: hypothetical protein ACXAB7_23925 [Candidatus Kariarchaeaceae archaeon]